jgi:hypothetical protein
MACCVFASGLFALFLYIKAKIIGGTYKTSEDVLKWHLSKDGQDEQPY